jgi:hypothetical protein
MDRPIFSAFLQKFAKRGGMISVQYVLKIILFTESYLPNCSILQLFKNFTALYIKLINSSAPFRDLISRVSFRPVIG